MAAKYNVPKWLLMLIGIILASLAGLWIWVETEGEKSARRNLPAVSQKASDSVYRAETSEVDIDLGTRDITLTDFELAPNSRHWAKLKKDLDLPAVRFSMRIPKLHIRHLSVRESLEDKALVADTLRIINPVIRITSLESEPAQKKDEAPTKIERIQVGTIIIENPDVAYTDASGREMKTYTAKGGRCVLRDWRFELDGGQDTTRLFYARRTHFLLRDVTLPDPKGLYRYTIGSVAYDQVGSVLRMADARITPRLSREAFQKRFGFQKEIYTVRFPLVRFTGIDWRSLVAGHSFMAQGGEIQDGDLRLYMDRVPPPNPERKDGMFPHQLLMKLPMPVYVPRLSVSNGQFAYTERNRKTMQAGTVRMKGINGALTNITNMPSRMRRDAVTRVALKGNFEGSTVDAVFRFFLHDAKAGRFSVEGGMSSMDGTRVNHITKPLALADIRSLIIDGIRFQLDGSQSGATGRLVLRYHDLDLDLLEKEDDGGLGKKHVTTLVADKLLLRKANPMPREDLRTAQPAVDHDPTKSFFNLVWKNIFTGMLQTVGRGSVIEKAVERQARKEKERRKDEAQGPDEKGEKGGFSRRFRGKEKE